jgi:DNA-binding PadR family transcriptional regulator
VEFRRPVGAPPAPPSRWLSHRAYLFHFTSRILLSIYRPDTSKGYVLLELAILGLLKEQELHGYELKKRLAETVGSGTGVSFGSLYPALGRLEKAGGVRVVPARAGAGRGKKVYAITDRGEALFEDLLAADAGSSEDERSFNLRLAFARHLPREARIGLLERRRAYLLARLARTRGTVRHGWGRFDAYTRSLLEHGNETTERDISWLDRLIAREREEAMEATPAAAAAPPGVGVSGVPGSGAVSQAGAPEGGAAGDQETGPHFPSPNPTAWAALAPPTMPVRPSDGPIVAYSSHSSGGNIQ